MRVLLVTDSFPPGCGGSGWSTWELARGLAARGHALTIVQPRPGARAGAVREYDGLAVEEFPWPAPRIPFVRNYVKNERLWPALGERLRTIVARDRIEVVHGQHVLSIPAAVIAGRRAGVPIVATVRDYWPVCYWGTLLVDPDHDALCPGCSPARMVECLRPRTGRGWPLALPAVPYMRRNLRARQRALVRADAVVAVSRRIAADLARFVPALEPARLVHIPNPFDVDDIVGTAGAGRRPLEGEYALYVGKLEVNKGADLLPRVAAAAALRMPLVLAGDGGLRAAIEREAQQAGIDVRCTGWLSRDEVLGWMASARVLVFPSRGPESLSRVLVEAGALGVPVAAMDTGGTRDIVQDGRTGLLAQTPDALAAAVRRIVGDPSLAAALGDAARQHVRTTFDARVVVASVERLYAKVAAGARHD